MQYTVPTVSALVLSLLDFVCLSVTPHFWKFPHSICVESSLRGRHPLRVSCTLKTGTMKARVEVRRDYGSFDCNVRHGARCTVLLSIETLKRILCRCYVFRRTYVFKKYSTYLNIAN